jgi:hypothetical protein
MGRNGVIAVGMFENIPKRKILHIDQFEGA